MKEGSEISPGGMRTARRRNLLHPPRAVSGVPDASNPPASLKPPPLVRRELRVSATQMASHPRRRRYMEKRSEERDRVRVRLWGISAKRLISRQQLAPPPPQQPKPLDHGQLPVHSLLHRVAETIMPHRFLSALAPHPNGPTIAGTQAHQEDASQPPPLPSLAGAGLLHAEPVFVHPSVPHGLRPRRQ